MFVSVSVCMDFMHRSRTAAQLKGFPPQSSVAVTETGLWDPLIRTDRVQAQLTSSCSFLSHVRRKKKAQRAKGGQQDICDDYSQESLWSQSAEFVF